MVKLGKSFLKAGSGLQIALFYFIEISNPPVYSEPPTYLILPNFPTTLLLPRLLGPLCLFGTQEYTNNQTIIETKVKP